MGPNRFRVLRISISSVPGGISERGFSLPCIVDCLCIDYPRRAGLSRVFLRGAGGRRRNLRANSDPPCWNWALRPIRRKESNGGNVTVERRTRQRFPLNLELRFTASKGGRSPIQGRGGG